MYLQGTVDNGVTLRPASLDLRVFSDVNWARDSNRRTTTDFVIYLFWQLSNFLVCKEVDFNFNILN